MAKPATPDTPIGTVVRLRRAGDLTRGYNARPGAAAVIRGHCANWNSPGGPALDLEWVDNNSQNDGVYDIRDFEVLESVPDLTDPYAVARFLLGVGNG